MDMDKELYGEEGEEEEGDGDVEYKSKARRLPKDHGWAWFVLLGILFISLLK
jgi:hypothetical protein